MQSHLARAIKYTQLDNLRDQKIHIGHYRLCTAKWRSWMGFEALNFHTFEGLPTQQMGLKLQISARGWQFDYPVERGTMIIKAI